jgi:hypothetical protein
MAILYPDGYHQLSTYYPCKCNKTQMIFWHLHNLWFNNEQLFCLDFIGISLAQVTGQKRFKNPCTGRLIMKKLTLILLSIAMGLLLGRYYSLVPKKLLLEYLLAAYLSIKFISNDEVNLIPAQK